jgi:hypothetical protein
MTLLAMVIPADCESVERTAYVLQWDEDILLSLPMPGPGTGYVTPTVIGGFDLSTSGSARHPDGRILTINPNTDELIGVTPATGEVEVLCTLGVDSGVISDLFWGVDGGLRYYRGAGSPSPELYRIDPYTCSLTLEAAIDGYFDTIEHHQGQYFAGGNSALWRIDPHTFNVTLIKDYSTNFGGYDVWGLASVGENLWRGMGYLNMWGGISSTIDLVDPISGEGDSYIFLPEFTNARPHALEVIEQPSPAAIPTLLPIGQVLLVLSFLVVGVLMSLRK